MAFGAKQHKITALEGQVSGLEAQLQGLDTELTGLKPWIGLAQTIRDAAAEHAVTMDIETAIGLAVHDIAEEQRRALVMTAFNRLDPEQQLEMLVSTFGDDILKKTLEEERQRRLSLTDSELALKLLVKEAREYRRFRPSRLPKDTKIELFFYDKGRLDAYTTQPSDDTITLPDPRDSSLANWARHIKGITVGDGGIAIHNDSISKYAGVSSTAPYAYRDHQIMSLCTPGDDSHEQPLYYGVGVRIPRPAETRLYSYMDLDLGPVFVNDTDIFGVLPERPTS